jgi:hypothetical protein
MSDAVCRENDRPGTRDWLLARVALEPDCPFRSRAIEGYCSHASVRAGERISFHLSADRATTVTIDFYRTGWYGGDGARHLLALGPIAVDTQPDPETRAGEPSECRWRESASLVVPPDWLSGVYLGKLTTAAGLQSYLVFVVADQRRADLMVKVSDLTWHAYNRWPRWSSVYDGRGTTWWSGPGPGVSFDRPYIKYCSVLGGTSEPPIQEWHDAPLSTGSGEYLLWEFPTVHWLESRGYDVTYVSCLDLHRDGPGLRRAAGLLSLGHDEYWSAEMYRHVQEAIAGGLSVAFLSGNSVCYRVDFASASASDGRPLRRFQRADLFCGRDQRLIASFPGMDELPNRSASDAALMGAGNVHPCTGGADWICTAPEHWLYQGSGMRAGDRIPGLVGWEWHGLPAPIPGLEVVATGTTSSSRGEGTYTATVYPGPQGNVVFNASTIWWGDGLSAPPGYRGPSVYTTPRGPDARVQRMTANLIARMLAGCRQPRDVEAHA